jgi:hypothetical protein
MLIIRRLKEGMGMKKHERIKEIVEYLITSGKFNHYTRKDIEKAIVVCRQALDERTVINWFNLLWKLEYILQPQCGLYALNVGKIQNLEVKLPMEVDPNQRRLI